MIRLLARCKVYLQRTMGYVQLIQAAMVLDIYLKAKHVPHAWFWPALAAAAVLALAWAYLEDRLGIFREESRFLWSRAPQVSQLLERKEKP
jgi:hypothetical protein